MRLSIYSPSRKLLSDKDVREVHLTSSEGLIQILPGHAPILGSLDPGPFAFDPMDGSRVEGFISHGFFEVVGDVISLTAETLELKDEIDLDRARKAQAKAEEALRDPSITEGHFKKYQLKLQRSLIRQQVSGRSH